jgi:3-methyladenine DNA glycosylase AlkD
MSTPAAVARKTKRELLALARPAGEFDARRYFRETGQLRFYNIGTDRMRRFAKGIVREQPAWSIAETTRFADILIKDPVFEAKAVGIEALACYRRAFTPSLLPIWKAWLARGDASNWATTDSICGSLIGPLLVRYPALARTVARWTEHRSLWVRRASAVGLIPLVRRGECLTEAYAVARRLHADEADLIQKAVGWMLREAGKTDMARLERYLRARGAVIPRTTLRYAIERFPPGRRLELLASTRKSTV